MTEMQTHNLNGKENKVFWVVERYVNNRLCYWAVGARGRASRDDWAEDISFAIRFADYPSAEAVMVHAAGGEGRTVAHMFAETV